MRKLLFAFQICIVTALVLLCLTGAAEPRDDAGEARLFGVDDTTLTDPTEEQLREALANYSVVNASWGTGLELTEDLTVPAGKTLNITGGTLTVDSGGTMNVSGKLSIEKTSEEFNPPPSVVNNGVITFRGGEVSIDVTNNHTGNQSADPKAILNNGVITFEDGFRLNSEMEVGQVTPNPCAVYNEKGATINIVGSGELYAKRKSGSAESIGAAITNYGEVNIGPAAPEASVAVGAESQLTLNCMARIENTGGVDKNGTMSVDNCKLTFEPNGHVIPGGKTVTILQNSSNMTIADSVIDVPINSNSDEVCAVSNSRALRFIGTGETRIVSGRIEIKTYNSTAEVEAGTLTLESGSIIKCSHNAGVTIAEDASMNINGGEVEFTDGSLINNSTLSISGGTVSKEKYGSGDFSKDLIINNGAMTMSGGEISIPKSFSDQSLAMVRVKDGGRFTMSGGTIATPMSAGDDTPKSFMGLVIDSGGEAAVLSNATISGNQGSAVINSGTLTIENNAQITGATGIDAPNGNLTVKVVPVGGATVRSLPDCVQYTGTVAWTPDDTTFAYNAEYTADIKVRPAVGFTLTKISDSSFTVEKLADGESSSFNSTVQLKTEKPDSPYIPIIILPPSPSPEPEGSMDNFAPDGVYNGFDDVDEGEWYGTSQEGVVRDAVLLGFAEGDGDGNFRPDEPVRIGEAIKLACMVYSTYYNDGFDFAEGEPWYQVYVDYAIEKGIIEAGDFADYDAEATRAQAAYIFAKSLPETELANISELTPPDVALTDEYGAEIYLLYAAGVLKGNDDEGSFDAGGKFTRAQAAAVVTRLAMADKRG